MVLHLHTLVTKELNIKQLLLKFIVMDNWEWEGLPEVVVVHDLVFDSARM